MSKNTGNIINDGYWLRRHAVQDGLPADCKRPYQILFNQGVGYFKAVVDSIIEKSGGSITLPMQPLYLEHYLSGFTFEYRTFCNLFEFTRETEGFWRIDPERPTHVTIFYNRCASRNRQRYTQVHELLHFVQTVDDKFLTFLDELILNSTLPEGVVVKLLERLTERATAMYLMPNDFFIRKYHEIRVQSGSFGDVQLQQLAKAFDVSVQTAGYRIRECFGTELLVPAYASNRMPP